MPQARQPREVPAIPVSLPATLLQQYFGLTGIDKSKLIEWSYWAQNDTFYNQPFDMLPPEQSKAIIDRHDQTGKELGIYIAELMVTREATKPTVVFNGDTAELRNEPRYPEPSGYGPAIPWPAF